MPYVCIVKSETNMITKPVIAIIGATGKMGSTLAGLFAQANHHLLLVDTEVEKLFAFVNDLKTKFPTANIDMQTCAKEGSWEADIIILTSSEQNYCELANKINSVATGKIVISVSNIIKATKTGTDDISAAEELQKSLPYSKVIKTFNAMMASDFISSAIDGPALDIFIAGNNSDAIATVEGLVKSVGFHPVVVGDLSVSRKLERMITQLSIKDNYNWLAGDQVIHS
jgi:hypothetical protein